MHPILYKNYSPVSGNFLPGLVKRHLKQLIYETNIFNIFNDFKMFLTIFNISVDHDSIFKHTVLILMLLVMVIPKCFLTLYTELNIVLAKLESFPS